MKEESFAQFGQRHADIRLARFSLPFRYALHGMVYLAAKPKKKFCLTEEIARNQNLPENFLAKILQRLARIGFLVSRRGPLGGYALAKPAEEILLADVVQAIDAPFPALRQCILEFRACEEGDHCLFHGSVAAADQILKTALQKISLRACLKSPTRSEILDFEPRRSGQRRAGSKGACKPRAARSQAKIRNCSQKGEILDRL